MTQSPILRSAALQKALAITSARRPAAAPGAFADVLQQARSLPPGGSTPRSGPFAARPTAARINHGSTLRPAPMDTVAGDVPYRNLLQAAASTYGVEPALLAGLVKQESNFNPNAQSPAGARGLVQLMPATARRLGVTDASDPAQSLDAGARFLAGLLKQFKGDESLALAAYNAGPGAVQKFGGIPPYEETQRYVPKVLAYTAQFRRIWADSNGTQNA